MDYRKVPPDGGWGWMVVLGSWIIHVLIFGLFRTGGIVLIECGREYHNSHSIRAWIPILNTGLAFFLAPIAAILVRKYGHRNVVFLGGLVCSWGLAICYFANQIEYVLLGYGVFAGCGLGLALNPNLTIVSLYFRKRQALATGISFSGGAFGVFIMGPLIEILIERYTLKGMFLILSAILLHISLGATLFQPIEFHLLSIPIPQNGFHLQVTPPPPRPRPILEITEEESEESYDKEIDSNGNLGNSLLNGYLPPPSSKPVPLACLDDEFLMDESSVNIAARLSFSLAHGPLVPKILVTTAEGSETAVSLASSLAISPKEALIPPNWRHDICFLFNELLLLVCAGYGIALASYIGVTIMLPDYIQSEILGKDTMDGYFCVMIAAIGDTIGRLMIGWFIDKLKRRKRHLYHICIFALGLAISILPFSSNYSFIVALCFFIGFFFGICLIHSPCFLVEYFGIDKISWTMGLMLTLAGIPILCLGPVIGIIKERTGTYKVSFWCLGSALTAVTICWFFLPIFLKKHKRQMHAKRVAV